MKNFFHDAVYHDLGMLIENGISLYQFQTKHQLYTTAGLKLVEMDLQHDQTARDYCNAGRAEARENLKIMKEN